MREFNWGVFWAVVTGLASVMSIGFLQGDSIRRT
jgi:hypothetical protein